MVSNTRVSRLPLGEGIYAKIKRIFGSERFFFFVVVLFVLQAGYIAIVSSFPMAFDESYHLGIIQLHAQQWSPFLSNLPASSGQFGALATDPSYLFHYLLSFPYRLVTAFTQDTFVIVLVLRFINIGFFALGIILFRKVLAYAGASQALVHIVLLGFVLLPLETFTAAQINYDNLLLPITAGALLLALRAVKTLKSSNKLDVRSLALLLALCLGGAQVKYVFMPIFAAIMLVVCYYLIRWGRQNRGEIRQLSRSSIGGISRNMAFLLIGVVVVSGSLFAWRYGYNIVQYHSLVPACEQVMGEKPCSAYPVWQRNHELALNHTAARSPEQFKEFMMIWINIMGNQLFTVLDANDGGAALQPYRHLVVGAKLTILIGLVFIGVQWRRLLRSSYVMRLFAVVVIAYMGALWFQNYQDYTRYGIPIAIQGRYLLPVILLMMIAIAKAYSLSLQKAPQWKLVTVAVVALVSLQGGGVTTFLARTNDSWRWIGQPVTQAASASAATALDTIIEQQ